MRATQTFAAIAVVFFALKVVGQLIALASPLVRGACATHPAPLCHTGQKPLCACTGSAASSCGWLCVAE